MPWLEVTLTVSSQRQPDAEAALEALDAQSVTLADADAETPDERAIFEPGAGETPVWSRTTLQALFEAGTDRQEVADALQRDLPGIAPRDLGFRDIADADWERAWMDRFQPMAFGNRLWVYPWNIEPPADSETVVVRLDPGLAFGSGTHPTTALCMEWLDGLDLDACQVLDYGCGSGLLAIAALKLGAAGACGIDNDPQALIATRDNATRNGVADNLSLYPPDTAPAAPADVLVANILAGPLTELASHLARLCKPGAPFALSGILDGQHEAILAAYAPWFERLKVHNRDGWLRIDGYRTS